MHSPKQANELSELRNQLMEFVEQLGSYEAVVTLLRGDPVFSDVSRATIYRWVKGKHKGKQVLVKRLARALEILTRHSTIRRNAKTIDPALQLAEETYQMAGELRKRLKTLIRFCKAT